MKRFILEQLCSSLFLKNRFLDAVMLAFVIYIKLIALIVKRKSFDL